MTAAPKSYESASDLTISALRVAFMSITGGVTFVPSRPMPMRLPSATWRICSPNGRWAGVLRYEYFSSGIASEILIIVPFIASQSASRSDFSVPVWAAANGADAHTSVTTSRGNRTKVWILLREWIRSDLKVCVLTQRGLTTLGVPQRPASIVGPDAPALPAGIHVVNPSVHSAFVESHWIWNPHDDPRFGRRVERHQRIGVGTCDNRHVGSEPEGIEAIDEIVVGPLSRIVICRTFEIRAGERIDGPPLGAVLACCRWTSQH